MFNVGEYVVYRRTVCKIREIKKNNINHNDYYVLIPIDDDTLVIDVPVENKLGFIKKIITKEEVEEIINNISNIDIIEINNEKELENEYRKLLDSGNHLDLIKIIKTSYLRNKERTDNKKRVSERDSTYFKIAETTLYNEFSVVLNMDFEKTKEYVIEKVNNNIGVANE